MKSFFIGKTLKDSDLNSEKFNVLWGLPIYSSDAISSVSYAGEEILLVLVPVLGLASYRTFLGCIAAIIGLLAILVFSYRQTIDTYPQGGGAYIVAAENLGRMPGLIAGASLTIGYILTVAVSACAGTDAILSAFSALEPYKVLIALLIVCLLTWGNLRGMRESSVMFGIPTYFFIGTILVMVVAGLVKYFILGYEPPTPTTTIKVAETLTPFLVLRAFSAGCTALTGVEAVSNGVPSFKDPSTKNAKRVLVAMAIVVTTIFVSMSFLTSLYHIVPKAEVTVVAQLASAIFGSNHVMFYVVQIATVVILALAANTAFAGLPLLLALMAKDGYMPRRFNQRGTRLGFSNGILMLFAVSAILIIIFQADTHLLLALYATGVFLSFTLSQAGMLLHWIRQRGDKWVHKAIVNGLGTAVTAITCIIIGASKFTQGAWIVLICIPALVILMLRIKAHYDSVAMALRIEGAPSALIVRDIPPKKIIVPVQSVNRSFIKALNYAMSLGGAQIEVFHVASEEEDENKLKSSYESLNVPIPLKIVKTSYRNYNGILIDYVDDQQKQLERGQMLTVVIPQFVVHNWWLNSLHNQTSIQLRLAFLKRRNVSVISIPYILDTPDGR